MVHGRKLGRALAETAPGKADGFRTLNLRFSRRAHAWKPAASGIFVVQVHGLTDQPLAGVANLGVRPSLDPNDVNGGRVLLETHVLDWPAHLGQEGAYGKIIRVDLLHKLHDELRYHSLAALTEASRATAPTRVPGWPRTAAEFDGAAARPSACPHPAPHSLFHSFSRLICLRQQPI